MIDRLIGFMKEEGWDLNSSQIADILWFLQQVPTTDIETSFEDNEDEEDNFLPPPHPPEKPPIAERLTPKRSECDLTLPPETPSPVPSPKQKPSEDLPIKVPDTGILRNTLELGRKAKPLKQKVDSNITKTLDIQKTVRKSAELSTPDFPIYFPVTVPQQERWLDVILLMEESDSMLLWQGLLPEVQDFLEHIGAFRDIKPYRMRWNSEKQNLDIYPERSPEGLIDASGRRLILILSDCISPAWYQDKFVEILQNWTSKGLLTVLNPFPESLWERTALGYCVRLRLKNQTRGLPVSQWEAIPVSSWEANDIDPKNSIKVPILSLKAELIEAWANVITGKGTSLSAGVWLEKNFPFSLTQEDTDETEQLSAIQQIERFYATSSKYAWQLIQWLSAIPISLSTIRLVQQTLVPHSTQVDVAEVVMGGLLTPKAPLTSYQHPQQIQFQFKQKEVREELLKRLGGQEFSRSVIRKLSDKLAERFGYSLKKFEAILLENPLALSSYEDIDLIQAFATVTISTLNQPGGKYANFVRQLERSRAKLELAQSGIEEIASLPWINFLEKIAQTYQLTAIETETLITLFPSPQSLRSISEAARHLNLANSTFKSRLSNVHQKFQSLLSEQKYNKLQALQKDLQTRYQQGSTDLRSFTVKVATLAVEEDPEELQKLELETVFVNKRGEIAQRQQCEVYYYDEPLVTQSDSKQNSIRMIAILEGEFWMGSPKNEKDRYSDESPQHKVTVPAFFMSRTPITQAQWRFVAALPQEGKKLKLNPSNFKGNDLPVEQVSWQDAIEFCARLSRYTHKNYCLPSEAEWEYAARAINSPLLVEERQGVGSFPFHFGETITSNLAIYDGSVIYQEEAAGEWRHRTTPVRSFPPNAFGLYDMHGNVWEWCLDPWHENYEGAPDDARVWDESNNDELYQNILNSINVLIADRRSHILRGGSWGDDPRNCRSASRNHDVILGYVGFRVVCVL